MAIKEYRKTWSNCQLDYVREYIVTSETDIENLPDCCIGSVCIVSETNNRYVYCKGKTWKLQEEAMQEGGEDGGSGSSGGSMEPIVIFINDEPMTASVTFEEAWSLSVSELAARLRACFAHDDIEIGSTFATVMKNNTRTWGRHIVIRFDYMDATSEFVIAETGYILWAEGADPQRMTGGMP